MDVDRIEQIKIGKIDEVDPVDRIETDRYLVDRLGRDMEKQIEQILIHVFT